MTATATYHAITAAERTADKYLARGYDTSPDWNCYGARFGGMFDCGHAWRRELSRQERAAFDDEGDFLMAVAVVIESRRA